MIEVKHASERLIVLRVRLGMVVFYLVSAYAFQVGRSMEQKEEFYSALGEFLSCMKEDKH